MTDIAGYRISQQLYASENASVYRARRQSDDLPVILKVLRQDYPTPWRVERFKREYGIVRSLDLAGVVRVYDLESDQHLWIIVMEDIGGESLDRLALAGTMNLADFLRCAIELADILGHIHQRHVIHKDVNPSNIILNPTTGQLRVIDFSIAVVAPPGSPTFRSSNILEGTLPYMSPEQTGRMNRESDYRTDLYSLGVTLYELLSGDLPFPATDPLELVHSHIARQPPVLCEHYPYIPQAVSNIIMKLLAKNAEGRYQSAYGLRVDLEECLRQWLSTGQIEPFLPGQYDEADRFCILPRLYGRSQEMAALLHAFERVRRGTCEMVSLSGQVGIGKSALAQELYKPVTRQQANFISGKFDQLQPNIPYSAFVQAFRSLVRQLLTRSEAEIATWRQLLLDACGTNGRLIIEVIPDVELIIGPQPGIPLIGSTEARHRFHLVFQNFIRVFTRPAHPLVLFLDDVQWADRASLKLLERLMVTSQGTRQPASLLVLIAYRDTDVDTYHPLWATLETIRRSGAAVHEIPLKPLDVPAVTQMAAETLHCSLEQARPLAEVVIEKSDGNPFFVHEFLQSLHNQGLIAFDYEQRHWRWDMQQVQSCEMTDNVIALMEQRVQRLPAAEREILKLASCIGNQFDLVTLAVVSERTPGEVLADLQESLTEGLISPVRNTYTFTIIDANGDEDEVPAEYLFAHDRIQQAVYAQIPEPDKPTVHWQVGQLLLWSMPPAEREERIFDLVFQLNWGTPFITSQTERNEIASLNLMAGRRAKGAAAYEAALNYLRAGIDMLEPACWDVQYTLALALYDEAVEVTYLLGRFEETEGLAQMIVQHAHSLFDMVPVYEAQMLAYRAQERVPEAIQVGLTVLASLGVTFPEAPDRDDVLRALMSTQKLLYGRDIAALTCLPVMADPHKLAAMRLLLVLGDVAQQSAPELFSLTVFRQITLSLDEGNAPTSAVAYAWYGLLLCGLVQAIDTGYQFGQLALHLVNQGDLKEMKTRVEVVVHASVRPCKEHLNTLLPVLSEVYRSALETGDVERAVRAAESYCAFAFYAGRELTELEREMAVYDDALSQLQQKPLPDVQRIYHQTVLNLLERSESWQQLQGEVYDETHMLPHHRETDNQQALCIFYFSKLFLCYLFREYEQAVAYADAAAAYRDTIADLSLVPLFAFYDSLARLAFLSSTDTAEQHAAAHVRQTVLEQVATNQRSLEQWMHAAPTNHQHKFYLVEAERARVLGNAGDAWSSYHQAAVLADQHGYLNEEALIHELTGIFYLEQDLTQFAHVALQDAYYAYLRWGAVAKAKDLEIRYPQVLAPVITPAVDKSRVIATNQTVYHETSTLDLTSVIRASQAISEDIVLDTLLANLVKIVIENAGAERGLLLLQKKAQWVIEAEGAVDKPDVTVLESIPVETADGPARVPLSIINYVAHTRENVVVRDATQISQFSHDRYFITHKPQSILCTPLLNQGNLTGILYLENNLAAGAFTSDQLEVLSLLSAQAAISIEKAKLYTTLQASLEQQVSLTKAYSRFVPREILQFLGKDSIMQVKLGDQIQQVMTVMFADIRDFTRLSEQMTPQENFNFLNSYLSRVSPIIREQNGFIDKYIGDAIMAIFPEQAADAIEAAIGMQKEVRLYNTHRAKFHYQPVSIGIGLHIGSLMLGTVGEAERMEGTVISDSVNLTARLEGLTKLYGAPIVVSESILSSLDRPEQYHVRFLGDVKVKGKQDAIAVFEILDGNTEKVLEKRLKTRPDFEQGLLYYRQRRFDNAIRFFERVLAVDSADQAARLYVQRAHQFVEYGAPLSWAGIEAFTGD